MTATANDGSGLRVGFAGIGKMGLPMARNVGKAGFPLTVFNRTAERCAPLVEAGATQAATPAELAAASDVVVTMVADEIALRALLDGEDGLLAGAEPGLVLLEMSTIGPTAARAVAAECGSRGVEMLDTPVSGSVAVAESAALVAMVGGDESPLTRARPVLEAMTKAHFHLGASGAGAAMKLAVNVMIAAQTVAISEALVLAEAAGIERSDAYEVIAAGALASPFVDYKRVAFLDPDGTPPAFALDLMRKDLRLALGQADAAGLPLLGAGASAEAMAVAAGLEGGDEDLVRVADALRRIASTQTAKEMA